MNYQPVIGLEVHVELNTKTKMFCRCSTDYFGKEPNTHTCPICLGLPGALPFINREAIEKCIMIGLALNCRVAEKSLFERKNYFYPDLPKGYQISQYRWPLCVNGWLEVEGIDGLKKIRINRAHQEEDTGKLSHPRGVTLIDFNRSGVPLVEIVTEPDFRDPEEVKDYAKKLQQIFRYLGVSNADMERGDMRLEANVSVHPEGTAELPNYRVELKNINSFRFMEAAIKYEIDRQIKAIESGEKLHQETRGWDEGKKQTYLQRSKEEANDYRYFPEPDLPELRVKNEKLRIKKNLPELPAQKSEKFDNMSVKAADIAILVESRELAEFFEKVVNKLPDDLTAQQVANYIVNKKPDINTVSPDQIIKDLSSRSAGVISDEKELEKIVSEALAENPKAVEDFKKGKENAMQVILGSVMKRTSGKADIAKVKNILTSLFDIK